MRPIVLASVFSLLAACAPPPAPAPPLAPPPAASSSAAAAPMPPPPEPRKLDRSAYNRGAIRQNEPLYWVADQNKNGEVDPDEVVALQFFPTRRVWAKNGKFTEDFSELHRKITASLEGVAAGPEGDRIKLVSGELDNASPALVYNDFRKGNAEEQAFVRRMLEVAARIDDLYAIQTGAHALASKVPADTPSQSLFRRNWGITCLTPGFDKNPACTAIPGATQRVDVYPEELQKQEKFCEELEKNKGVKGLLDPFTVVRWGGSKPGEKPAEKLTAIPYSEAYKPQMKAVAEGLRAAASELKGDKEKALKTYLAAAAKSFESNDWLPADEAWSRMNAQNSSWYVRVGPDETYWEPCSHKAGFHLSFARINPASLRWQERLAPLRQEMEDRMAAHIGGPYKARKVSFHLPDFIDIVVNAGDDRSAVGATIGQSLPNWGKVAAQGRGRTVVMSNLYTDVDSLAVRRAKVTSLMSKETAGVYVDEQDPGLISTILHEAAHNLGPTHEHKVKGKKDSAAFGGDLASMLEELKAQSASLWYVAFLQKKGILDEKTARQVYVDSLIWAFNHIARGMWTANHQRKHYSQLAAIQVGILMDEKALVFDPEARAANGSDKGAYRLDFDKLPGAIERMMAQVGQIKSQQDKTAADALTDKYVDGLPEHHKRIAERCLRHPQPNFVYAVELP